MENNEPQDYINRNTENIKGVSAENVEQPKKKDAKIDNRNIDSKKDSHNTDSEVKKTSKLPLILFAVVILIAGLVFLFCELPAETTELIRDIALIIFVLESIVALIAFVVMISRLSQLFNFLKYELKPIIENTQKSVKRFSGTVSFLCDNAVEPTIGVVSKVAGVQSAVNGFLGIFKKL